MPDDELARRLARPLFVPDLPQELLDLLTPATSS